MNEVDIKQLIDVGQRNALLLGEITGRLIMMEQVVSLNDNMVPVEEIQSLLKMMNERISSIYYGVKDE